MGHLRVVIQVLKEHQLFTKYKCKFLLRSVSFLGHIISSAGIEVDPNKTKVVKNWPRPLTPPDSRSFLGLTGYYQRLVDGFASISSSLTTLTQKNSRFQWLEAYERGFQELKYKLISALVLTLPEGNEGFLVYCDAYQVGWDVSS